MTVNPYFNKFNYKPEQTLADSLVREYIQIHGIDIYYIPRTLVNEDFLFTEDNLSRFSEAIKIEMYLENFEGFQGGSDFMSKFGLQIEDQMNLVVSRTRFREMLPEKTRPHEGDLIFFPFTSSCYEIKFVEDEHVFYSFGDRFTFQLQCESWMYSHEQLQTGIPEIDSTEWESGFVLSLRTTPVNMVEFENGEFVYQGNSVANAFATANVAMFNPDATLLYLNNISGNFVANVVISAPTSGAIHNVVSIASEILLPTQNNAINANLESEASTRIDFSESDPFSENQY